LSRDRILRQIDGSLARLGAQRIALYMTHEPDPDTPLEETLDAMDSLVRDGRVGAFGACNIEGWRLEQALGISAERSLAKFGWVQNSFSLLDRGVETDVLPVCVREGVGFTPFSPLAGGWLTGKYVPAAAPTPGSRMTLRPEPYRRFENARTFGALDRFCQEAGGRGVEPATLAIAWLLGHPQVDAVIVGPRRPEHLDAARRALELVLSDAERAELAAIFDD
jgi:aryl-alcohol dehydrogenase-like predicted oxidoreductase